MSFFHASDYALNPHSTAKVSKLWFLYLLPGVEDHDIISGKIILGHLPGYLLNLREREGFRGAILMHCVHKGL